MLLKPHQRQGLHLVLFVENVFGMRLWIKLLPEIDCLVKSKLKQGKCIALCVILIC